jgi:hypothetical protein
LAATSKLNSGYLILADAVPDDAIARIFPSAQKTLVTVDPTEFRKIRADYVPLLCQFIWHEMVRHGIACEPYGIGSVWDESAEVIHAFVRQQLQDEPILDALVVEYRNGFAYIPFAQVSIVRCFPNDLHICDVQFSDNRSYIDVKDPARRLRDHRGLHVFGEFLDRLIAVAKASEVDRISLICRTPALHQVFERYGFQLNDTAIAKLAQSWFGCGHSMILRIL